MVTKVGNFFNDVGTVVKEAVSPAMTGFDNQPVKDGNVLDVMDVASSVKDPRGGYSIPYGKITKDQYLHDYFMSLPSWQWDLERDRLLQRSKEIGGSFDSPQMAGHSLYGANPDNQRGLPEGQIEPVSRGPGMNLKNPRAVYRLRTNVDVNQQQYDFYEKYPERPYTPDPSKSSLDPGIASSPSNDDPSFQWPRRTITGPETNYAKYDGSVYDKSYDWPKRNPAITHYPEAVYEIVGKDGLPKTRKLPTNEALTYEGAINQGYFAAKGTQRAMAEKAPLGLDWLGAKIEQYTNDRSRTEGWAESTKNIGRMAAKAGINLGAYFIPGVGQRGLVLDTFAGLHDLLVAMPANVLTNLFDGKGFSTNATAVSYLGAPYKDAVTRAAYMGMGALGFRDLSDPVNGTAYEKIADRVISAASSMYGFSKAASMLSPKTAAEVGRMKAQPAEKAYAHAEEFTHRLAGNPATFAVSTGAGAGIAESMRQGVYFDSKDKWKTAEGYDATGSSYQNDGPGARGSKWFYPDMIEIGFGVLGPSALSGIGSSLEKGLISFEKNKTKYDQSVLDQVRKSEKAVGAELSPVAHHNEESWGANLFKTLNDLPFSGGAKKFSAQRKAFDKASDEFVSELKKGYENTGKSMEAAYKRFSDSLQPYGGNGTPLDAVINSAIDKRTFETSQLHKFVVEQIARIESSPGYQEIATEADKFLLPIAKDIRARGLRKYPNLQKKGAKAKYILSVYGLNEARLKINEYINNNPDAFLNTPSGRQLGQMVETLQDEMHNLSHGKFDVSALQEGNDLYKIRKIEQPIINASNNSAVLNKNGYIAAQGDYAKYTDMYQKLKDNGTFETLTKRLEGKNAEQMFNAYLDHAFFAEKMIESAPSHVLNKILKDRTSKDFMTTSKGLGALFLINAVGGAGAGALGSVAAAIPLGVRKAIDKAYNAKNTMLLRDAIANPTSSKIGKFMKSFKTDFEIFAPMSMPAFEKLEEIYREQRMYSKAAFTSFLYRHLPKGVDVPKSKIDRIFDQNVIKMNETFGNLGKNWYKRYHEGERFANVKNHPDFEEPSFWLKSKKDIEKEKLNGNG